MLGRYLFPFISTGPGPLLVKWDEDEGDAREMTMIIYEDLNWELSIWAIGTSVSIDCPPPRTPLSVVAYYFRVAIPPTEDVRNGRPIA